VRETIIGKLKNAYKLLKQAQQLAEENGIELDLFYERDEIGNWVDDLESKN
jgi:hypothetical protein